LQQIFADKKMQSNQIFKKSKRLPADFSTRISGTVFPRPVADFLLLLDAEKRKLLDTYKNLILN
jgi:hypothetical protein